MSFDPNNPIVFTFTGHVTTHVKTQHGTKETEDLFRALNRAHGWDPHATAHETDPPAACKDAHWNLRRVSMKQVRYNIHLDGSHTCEFINKNEPSFSLLPQGEISMKEWIERIKLLDKELAKRFPLVDRELFTHMIKLSALTTRARIVYKEEGDFLLPYFEIIHVNLCEGTLEEFESQMEDKTLILQALQFARMFFTGVKIRKPGT